MKKINLFNKTISPLSDGKGCPVERGGVWELPRRTPCATPSWKEGEHKVPSFRGNAESPRCCRELVYGKTDGIPLFSGMTKKICHKFPSREGWRVAPAGVWFATLVALFVATPSFAEPTELDKKTVASKAYVDTKQDKITTGLVEFDDLGVTATVPALVVTNSTGTALNGNTIGFLDLNTYSILNSGLDELPDTMVPSIGLLNSQLQDFWNGLFWVPLTWNNTQSTAINAYNSTFGTGTNQWAGQSTDLINGYFLANSLALKQNKITTGLVGITNNVSQTRNIPISIVTYDSAGGVLGNKIGIFNQNALDLYDDSINIAPDEAWADTVVPTLKMMGALQPKLPAAMTGTTNDWDMASTGGQTIDLGTIAGMVGQRYITAGGSQPLTKKSGADNVILYINGTKTLAQYQTSNFGGTTSNAATTGQNYIKGALVSLELLKDVYSALHTEIQNATPTGTPGNVAMYDATTGALSDGVATYDGSTTYNASTDADKIAVMSGVQRKKECGGYEPAPAGQPAHDGTHPGDEDYCWLWIFPD